MIQGHGVRSLALLRAALALIAGTVVIEAALGFAGALSAAPLVVAVAALGAAVGWCARAERPARSAAEAADDRLSPDDPGYGVRSGVGPVAHAAGPAAGAALAVALIERAWTGLHRDTFLYDVLSYHLHLPAAWRAAGRLVLVPTPFGDPAPGYTPANAELLFGLALAGAGNATLAHAGQLPFAALGALAIHATARVLGASRAVGLTAALAFLLIPEVWQQAPTAMADLTMASFFLSALPFLLRLEGAGPPRWCDVLALGAALGLLLGTKYVALVLSLPLLSWTATVVARRWRRAEPEGPPRRAVASALVALAVIIVACGGFWYLRNAVLTGNPIFPASLSIGGRAVWHGLLDSAALRSSEYHMPVGDLAALGDIAAECGWGFWTAVALAAWVTWRSGWPVLLVAVILLVWCVVPYQQSRFFFAAWGLGAIALAAATVRAPRVGWSALLAATAGSILQFPTGGRLAVLAAGVLGALSGALAATVAVRRPRGTAFARRLRNLDGRIARSGLAGALALALVLALVWARTRRQAPAYSVGDGHDAAWDWMRGHAQGGHIAYTGSNLPLPLWGPRFENVVRYVPISGALDSAPHQFLQVRPPSADETPSEPAPERQLPVRERWLANLDAFAADWVFVARMAPGVARANRHDSDDFPVERAWADALPTRFTPAYASDGVRIYRVRPALAPASLP